MRSQERFHVSTTSRRIGKRDSCEFRGFAGDVDVPEDWFEESADEVGEGIEVVNPVAPEGLDLGVGYCYAAEVD